MGKGDKVRDGLDTEKYGENLYKVNQTMSKRCGSCDGFKGVRPTGHAICKKDVVFDINNDDQCESWYRGERRRF
jgi:hypothetical protein